MKILKMQQGTPEWKAFRKGKITGTKSSDCLSTARKTADGSTVKKGFWELLAERLTINEDDGTSDSPMVRGHELEKDCAEITVAKFKLKNPCYDCGVWVSDDENIILSPDCHEDCENPTWAIECKALNSAEHIKTIYRDLESRLDEIPEERFSATNQDYCASALYRIPQEYKEQAIDYFIINKNLKTLYFSLYDPRFKNNELAHWVFVIRRDDIVLEMEILKNAQKQTLNEIDKITDIIENALKGHKNEH